MSTNYRCDGVSISLISIGSNKTTQLFDVPQNHELYQLFRAWQAESARDKMQFFFSVINSGYIILEAEASWSTVRQQASCSKPIKSSWEVTSRLIIIWQQQTASKTALANGTAERRHSNSCCARHPRIRVASAYHLPHSMPPASDWRFSHGDATKPATKRPVAGPHAHADGALPRDPTWLITRHPPPDAGPSIQVAGRPVQTRDGRSPRGRPGKGGGGRGAAPPGPPPGCASRRFTR